MQRVERHVFTGIQELDNICFLSKNLYNYTMYNYRLAFIVTGKIPSMYSMINWFTQENQVDYRALPAQTAQQVILQVDREWKSFFKAIKQYKQQPERFKGKPNLPYYKAKDGRNLTVFTGQQVKLKEGYIHFPERANITPLKTKIKSKVKQVRIVAQHSCYIIEVVYEKQLEEIELNDNLFLSMDLGINNLATLITNSAGLKPLLVNGKIIKSINQFYNKKKAELMAYVGGKGDSKRIKKLNHSRNMAIQNYIHHTSRFIIDYCIEHKIKNIIIGYNAGWKQEVKIGKSNNQKFVSIPYLTLINQVKYKAEEIGIVVQEVKESYTSKVDSFALEEIRHHEQYSGKRKKRGLFQSLLGLFNADVNGALNILRKVIGDDFISLLDKSTVSVPVRVNPLAKT